MLDIRRREFIAFLGAAAAWPLAARAKQVGKIYSIGLFNAGSAPPFLNAFFDGLRELGWIEGKDVVFEHRYASRQSTYSPVPIC